MFLKFWQPSLRKLVFLRKEKLHSYFYDLLLILNHLLLLVFTFTILCFHFINFFYSFLKVLAFLRLDRSLSDSLTTLDQSYVKVLAGFTQCSLKIFRMSSSFSSKVFSKFIQSCFKNLVFNLRFGHFVLKGFFKCRFSSRKDVLNEDHMKMLTWSPYSSHMLYNEPHHHSAANVAGKSLDELRF